VASTTPTYLKLHLVDEHQPEDEVQNALPGFKNLSEIFEKLTGWTLAYHESPQSRNNRRQSKNVIPAPMQGKLVIDDMSSQLPPQQSAIHRGQCDQLIDAFNVVVQELEKTRYELWKREAELAANVPVIHAENEDEHLAVRLEASLQCVTQAVQCDAAALYVLNDDTSMLKMRSCFGMSSQKLLTPARELKGAVADLEALVGHAVVLEDTSLLPHWNPPEDFAAAVCVPVSSATVPLGTLWVFSHSIRDFDEQETNVIEVVAGRLAAELEREAAIQHGSVSKRLDRQVSLASNWQQERLPNLAPMLDNWVVDGWTQQSDDIGGDFHDWSILPTGELAISVGDAQGAMIESGLTAATLQTAVKSHGCYLHNPQEMLSRVNETLWTSGLGDQFASLFYGTVHPESGETQFSVAGRMGVVVLGKTAYSVWDDESLSLGVEPDTYYRLAQNFVAKRGDHAGLLGGHPTRIGQRGDGDPRLRHCQNIGERDFSLIPRRH